MRRSGLSRCPVCLIHLMVRPGGVLPRHRDHRFDADLVPSSCPGSGQTLLRAAQSVANRPKERPCSS